MGRKVLRKLNKPCLECSGKTELVKITTDEMGVSYETLFEECISCGNKEKIRVPDRYNEFNLKN